MYLFALLVLLSFSPLNGNPPVYTHGPHPPVHLRNFPG